MKRLLAILFSFLVIAECLSQTGPNLTVGVSEVLYNKGKLDSEIIAEIVATKRGEIKAELAKRLILDKFQCSSFATYYYVQKTLNLLLDETNKEVISKGLLENSAEMLMVYGFAEFYLRELSKRKDQLEPYEKAFLKEMGLWATYENRKQIQKYFGTQFEGLDDQRPMTGKGSVPSKSDKGTAVDDILSMDKISYLPLFSNSSKYFGEQRNKCIDIAPVHILMDMVFEILKTNPQVREAGFFKNFPITREMYASQNKFYRIRNKGAEGQPQFNERIGNHIIGKTDDHNDSLIYKSINNRVTLIFSFFNTLQSLQKKIEKKEDALGLDAGMMTKLKKELKQFDIFRYQAKFRTEIDSLQRLILNTSFNIDKTQLANLTDEQDDLILSLKVFTDNLSRDYIYDVKNLESSRLYLENKLIPRLTVLNSASFASYKKIIVRLDTLSKYIRLRGLQGVLNRIDAVKRTKETDTLAHSKTEYYTTDNRNFFEYFKLYFEIVSVINNLDQIKSYDKTFKFLLDITGTFGNEKTQQVASLITSAYDKYTVLNSEENKLTLDVESMAVDLFNRYGDNNSRMVGMYFSVGINYAYNFKKSEYVVQEVTMPSKFSFVSEKIGVVVKLFDNNRRYSFGKMTYKPIINNVHALGYLSGLLYQIDFLNSNDEFKTPIYGAGLGVTSFNGLDLNLTYAVPFETNFSNGLWSVGLDIKITEYLGALKKKKSSATH